MRIKPIQAKIVNASRDESINSNYKSKQEANNISVCPNSDLNLSMETDKKHSRSISISTVFNDSNYAYDNMKFLAEECKVLKSSEEIARIRKLEEKVSLLESVILKSEVASSFLPENYIPVPPPPPPVLKEASSKVSVIKLSKSSYSNVPRSTPLPIMKRIQEEMKEFKLRPIADSPIKQEMNTFPTNEHHDEFFKRALLMQFKNQREEDECVSSVKIRRDKEWDLDDETDIKRHEARVYSAETLF